MARNDLTVFEEFSKQIGDSEHDFQSDVLKLGIVDDIITPTAADATPSWGDYSANEVSTAGGYVAGGITLANVTFTEAGGTATLNADDVSLALNASGFTDGYWGIIYNDTNVGDLAIAFLDFGGPVSEAAGTITITWNASGIATIAA